MHCQICDAFCTEDIAEYNETIGKMDFICPNCGDSHKEIMSDFKPTLSELTESMQLEFDTDNFEGDSEDDYREV